MVLEFGLLKSQLFPASDAIGEGLTGNTDEAIRNEIINGQTVSIIYSNSTFASVHTSTTETDLCSYQMPANTVTNGIIVMVTGAGRGFNAGGESNLRLYIGPNGSETLKVSQNIAVSDHGTHPMALLYCDTSQNWNNIVSIEVRGKNDVSGASDITSFHDMVVLGF